MYVHKNIFVYLSVYISSISKSVFLSITYCSEIYIWLKSQLKELQSWENRARTRGIRDFVRRRSQQARSVAPSPLLIYIGIMCNYNKLNGKSNLKINSQSLNLKVWSSQNLALHDNTKHQQFLSLNSGRSLYH